MIHHLYPTRACLGFRWPDGRVTLSGGTMNMRPAALLWQNLRRERPLWIDHSGTLVLS